MDLGDLSAMLAAEDNETNATSAFTASTGNATVSPTITHSPSMATNETNQTLAPTPSASNEMNATSASNETNVTVVPLPAPTLDELVFRKSLDNPQNIIFCGR
jgi:hypothetical protein